MTYKSQSEETVNPAIVFLEARTEEEDLKTLVEQKWRGMQSLSPLKFSAKLAPS